MALKKLIFHCIFKKWFGWGGEHFCCQHFFLKKPNTLEYAQVLVVTCPKLSSVTALLSPHPIYDFLFLLSQLLCEFLTQVRGTCDLLPWCWLHGCSLAAALAASANVCSALSLAARTLCRWTIAVWASFFIQSLKNSPLSRLEIAPLYQNHLCCVV